MEKLSKMQKRVYEYIVQSIQDNGYAPSVREIGEALGLKSPSTVHFHVKHLEELGLIEKGAGKGRAIALKKKPNPLHRREPPQKNMTKRSSAAIRCRSLGMSRRAARSLPRNAWRII